MNIDSNKLLWRTRGFEWEYTFIQYPKTKALECIEEEAYSIKDLIFGGVPALDIKMAKHGAHYEQGTVVLTNGEKHSFYAVAFNDPDRRDRQEENHGRPLAHYMVLFSDLAPPQGWGQVILDAAKNELDRLLLAPEASQVNLPTHIEVQGAPLPPIEPKNLSLAPQKNEPLYPLTTTFEVKPIAHVAPIEIKSSPPASPINILMKIFGVIGALVVINAIFKNF